MKIQDDSVKEKLDKVNRAIANYEELFSDIDDPEYMARGNGFCDSKFSEAFIESQLERLRLEKKELEEVAFLANPYKSR